LIKGSLLLFCIITGNNPQHPINSIKIELEGPYKLLHYMPYYSLLEWLLKCFVFQTIDLTLNILSHSEQKERIVQEVSAIVIKNVLDPFTMAVELIDYVSKESQLDESQTQTLQLLLKMLPHIRKIIPLIATSRK
jgi:hypothetical protein